MVEIARRWEWRSFGRRFGEAETQLAAVAPGGAQESDEIYLLSDAGGNVKVRDALDIKVLKQVNADGLEQWMPVMKAGYPLPASEAAKVFGALRLPAPSLSGVSYTLDEIIKEFAALGCAIREVKVHKRGPVTQSAAARLNFATWSLTTNSPARSPSSRRMQPGSSMLSKGLAWAAT